MADKRLEPARSEQAQAGSGVAPFPESAPRCIIRAFVQVCKSALVQVCGGGSSVGLPPLAGAGLAGRRSHAVSHYRRNCHGLQVGQVGQGGGR